MKRMFFDKPIKIFFEVGQGKFGYEISKQLNVTQPHLSNIVNKFHDSGLVSKEKKGRICILELTKKGKMIKNHLKQICKKLEAKQND